MTRWRIDPSHSSLHISFRPGLPGFGPTVTGITGEFGLEVGDDGLPDLAQPVDGSFALEVGEIRLGPGPLTRAVRSWLGHGDQVAIAGTIGEVTADGDEPGSFRFVARIDLGGHHSDLDGSGVVTPDEDGGFTVDGRTVVDPRQLGIPIPRILGLRCISDWDLHLTDDRPRPPP